ncbi:MAG: hypothetical protein WA211_03990 [Candidatus Acidiferrales bacterium]
MKNAICVCINTVGMLLFSLALIGAPPMSEQCDGINFQFLTDKTVYRPGAAMKVKFTVENTAQSPLYLFRLSGCSSQMGSYLLLIHDRTNRVVNQGGCSVDFWWDQVDVVQMLTDPKSGIRLSQNEIYGSEELVKLPAKRGSYRLEGEVVPAAYTALQRIALASKEMRVLDISCPAPTVTIKVK